LYQPVDVGIVKLLKDELRNRWESWMIQEEAAHDGQLTRRECIDSGTTPPPKTEQIATWTIAALQSISTQTVKNAWCNKGLWMVSARSRGDLGMSPSNTMMIRTCLLCLVCH